MAMAGRRRPDLLLRRRANLSARSPLRSNLSTVSGRRPPEPADPARAASILAEKDWFARLNSEFAAALPRLGPRFVVRVLHAAVPLEPRLCVRLYVWASRFGTHFARDASVRRALEDALWRRGPLVLSAALVAEVRGCGCEVSEELLCSMIASWGRLGLAQYAHEVFVQMPRLGLRPSTAVYNALIAASVRAGAVDTAYLRFQQMPADGCQPDCFTYNTLVHGVCRSGIVDEALRLVRQMEGVGIKPNVFTYTMLVDGFCNAGRPEDALHVFNTMKDKGVSPNEASYRTLVHGAFRCLGSHKAYEMLSEWIGCQPPLHPSAWHTMLYCLSKNEMAKEVVEVVKKMKTRGLLLDNAMFGIVVSCAVKCLELSDLCELVDDFVKKGGNPGFHVYIMIIKSLLDCKSSSKANHYLERMVLDGLLSSVASYNMVIDCFVKEGAVDRAVEIIKQMREKGFLPNLVTFNILISGYSKLGDVHNAKAVLKLLMEDGFMPDIITFTSLIDGLCHAHQMDDAFDCFSEMAEWGVRPNAHTYNVLMRALCSVGHVNKAIDLLNKMKIDGITPDAYSFNAPILSFCRMKKVDKARSIFNAMLRLGVVPDGYTCNILIKALCDEKRVDDAKEILAATESSGCTVTDHHHSYWPIVSALTKMGRFSEAGQLMNKCHIRNVQLDCGSNRTTEPAMHARVVNV
ncbi:putative pentatricopeptide repeat-containing protein At3g16890, mitochondrial [Aegilops tauschii subsp. strangulata]|nr:putative pentatricopeptide repeat-containing protein At3g16890, mitochondrial [Aegilops tauschii subsp. strangulata]XP_020184614.1 putative pentatricopeptide repeat-containing protein At3g16890, mitochondrial [Aegilops tauschii subsp. strangulata]XP_020184615.1 putative pentatricopeptide repeat-containing protein At3g16890, mitochondrial [Aegilops tauschii subsp. strangulata]XP_020184616.1 putative pentatricopeptide repeat-containing protein At3g16890, mitochondrial [Aegilops tauschii subsp. 